MVSPVASTMGECPAREYGTITSDQCLMWHLMRNADLTGICRSGGTHAQMLFPSWSVGDRLDLALRWALYRHPSTSWPLCLRCQIIRANSQLKEGRGHAPIIHFLYTRKEDPAVIIDNTPLNDAPNVCFLGNTLSYKVFSLSVVQTCSVSGDNAWISGARTQVVFWLFAC